MVTIIQNPITFLAPKFGTLVVMILALWYFQNDCPGCVCYDQVCPDCICPDKICPELSCPPIIQESICMVVRSSMIVIQPCYMGGMDISNRTKIDRDFLDSKNVDRSPTLVITIPVSIQFDNSYARVVFAGYARQYYFPNINERFSYVISNVPIAYIKQLAPNNATGCVSELYYVISNDAYATPYYGGLYHNNACIPK